jgi:hypothetical protein
MARNIGQFKLHGTVSGSHTAAVVLAGINYAVGHELTSLACSHFGAGAITKARIVYHTTYTNNYAYLEIYVSPTSAVSINVEMTQSEGWILQAPSAGSIPSDYTNKEITLKNGIVSLNGFKNADGTPHTHGTDTMDDGAVTAAKLASNAVTYAKFQQMAANSIMGNNTAAAANAKALTAAEVRTLLGVTEGATSVTHAELTTRVSNSTLIQGQTYRITDFKTIYKQPVSNAILEGVEEPIVVTALSANKLEPVAFSPSNPYDVIYYDVTKNNSSMYEWATSTDKGQIYRRITKNGNDLPYDVRAIKFRRYKVNAPSSAVAFAFNTDYNVNSIVTYNNKVYTNTVGVNTANGNKDSASGNYTPGSENNDCPWILLVDLNSYISASASGNFTIKGKNTINCPVNTSTSNYKDFYTFDDGNGISTVDSTDVCKNKIGVYKSSSTQKLNNSVFIGNSFSSNTIGNNFYSNTIGNYFYYNTIGNYFYSNTIGNLFSYNTIDNYFQSNTIGNNFNSNTIGNYFQSNTIGNYFNSNRFGNRFRYNNLNSYTTASTEANWFKYNEFGNGIQFSSVKNWGTSGWDHFKADYTVQVFKASTGAAFALYHNNTALQSVQLSLT